MANIRMEGRGGNRCRFPPRPRSFGYFLFFGSVGVLAPAGTNAPEVEVVVIGVDSRPSPSQINNGLAT